jgi:hypothetical protein
VPISVQCPACQKKLKARDDLAGKRIKCPACGQPVLIPSVPSAAAVEIARTAGQLLIDAAVADDAGEVARLLNQVDFTMAEDCDESDGDDKAALVVEVDDFPAMVAFTSDEHAQTFADTDPDLLDADGTMPAFVVSGTDLIANLPEDFGLLLNPESDECAVLTPDLMNRIRTIGGFDTPQTAQRSAATEADSTITDPVRSEVLAFLEARGFQPARWLPLPDMQRTLRPVDEIVRRLMGLAALFTWVSAPDDAVSKDQLRDYIRENRLRAALTDEEAGIFALPRQQARAEHADSVGWRLENMWPLAWVLGFEPEPDLAASQIDESISREILFEFLAGQERTVEQLVEMSRPRDAAAVIGLEDRFYCAHNAVRSAQLGEPTVPEGFHPVVHGGAVHERRHSLTWCLSPGVAWDDTDLST